MGNDQRSSDVDQAENAELSGAPTLNTGLGTLLAPTHTGTKISASGILGRIRDGRHYNGLNYGCGEMLRHLERMAARFYSGDVKAVDEFLQLYDLAEKREANRQSSRDMDKPQAETVMMPRELTAENGAKAALMGEFSINFPTKCCCHGVDEDCEVCEGTGEYMQPVNVPWVTLKEIYRAAVKHLGC